MEKKRQIFQKKHGILKRVLSIALVFAMVVTMGAFSQLGGVVAKAADSVRLYFELPEGTEAGDWIFNVWGGASATGGENARVGGTWKDQYFPTLLAAEDKEGWAYIDVTGTVGDCQFVKWVKDPEDTTTNPETYQCWESLIAEKGLDEAYFAPSNQTWYEDSAKTTKVKDAVSLRLYFELPEGTEAGDWIFNVWGGASATGGENARVGGTWKDQYFPTLLAAEGKEGWAYIDVTGTVGDCQFVKWVKDPEDTTTNPETYQCWEPLIAEEELTEAYYSPSDNKWYKEDSKVTIIEENDGTEYTYNIYYFDRTASHMSVDASEIYMWGTGFETFFGDFDSLETLSDGNQWLKTTVTLASKNPNLIVKIKGGNAYWTWQTNDLQINNTSGSSELNVYVLNISATNGPSELFYELPQFEVEESRERYLVVEYDRADQDYEGWNIYAWSGVDTSSALVQVAEDGNSMIPVQKSGDKWIFKVPIQDSSEDFKFEFCMRRGPAGEPWKEKLGGNHLVVIPAEQSVVKIKFNEEGITEVFPYNTGYVMDGANNAIHFYYRDDELFADNKLASLDGKVSITINGNTYPMVYDAAAERFSYDLSDIEAADYYYYYTADGEDVLDAFNEEQGEYGGKTCSKLTYREFDLEISAELLNPTMDYNDNNVLRLTYHPAAGQSMDDFEAVSAVVDLSALGLGEQDIDLELMEAAIACKEGTSTGIKILPVTVTDVYGNVYSADASVTVTARNKSGDFDWDEAIIYFAVTDRFFDGDTSNNNAYDADDYDTSAKGGSSYHGGDFAGLNAKLDYLKELGVNTIWITPVVENITTDIHDPISDTATYGYHGYWASDFTKLNKHLGTEAEFSALLDAAHARGMKIMVDVVLNHSGYGTENYFNSLLPDGTKMIRDADHTIPGSDIYSPSSGLPDFMTEDPEVRAQIIEWQTNWMKNYDIDYYRVDTVKHVDHTTWAAFKNALTEINPDFKMIGEYYDAEYTNTAGELGTGTMDSLLDFGFNNYAEDFVGGNISGIESTLAKRNAAINNTAALGQFLSSHDKNGLQYTLINNGFSEEEAYNLMKVAATLQITAKGQPVIYYGEEIGQTGAHDWPVQSNRYDFDWDELAAQQADSNSMHSHYKALLAIRNAYSEVFAKGDRQSVLLSDEDGYDVMSRSYNGTTLYVGMNITDKAQTLAIPVTGEAGNIYEDLYSGSFYEVSKDGTVNVTVPAAGNGGTVVLVNTKTNDTITPPKPPTPSDTNNTPDVNTGDNTPITAVAVALVFGGTLTVVGARRRKRVTK